MSLIDWFSRKKPARIAAAAAESSGLARMEATRPVTPQKNRAAVAAPKPELAANRKTERMARRELLYNVVRESMVRAGVLSASYKFKVLSLDQRGRQFMVMVDLAQEFGGETARLAEIEALIAQHAKARYDIVVTAVYWRMNEHVAVGRPQQSLGTPSSPAPLVAQPLPPVIAPSRQIVATPRYEPIEADEVAAFKQALAAAAATAPIAAVARSAQAHAHAQAHGPRNYTLLTGYEDTEMTDGDVRTPALGGTQYGELT